MRTHFTVILALATISTGLCAQSIAVPNASATTSTGLLLNNLLRNMGQTRSYMQGIAAAELSGLPVGAVITGFSMRNANTASNTTFPSVDTTWANYDITIGAAIPLASWTTTFMNNFSGTPTTARAGPMVIEAGAFNYNGAITTPRAQAWSEFYWDLQTPFTYLGGDLGIYYTHPGSNNTASIFLDSVTSGGNTIAYTAATYQATTATGTTNFCAMRIHYGYGTGCPGTGGQSPNLVLTSNVAGGGVATFAGANALPSGIGIFALGTQQLAIPLPGGCTLLNNAVIILPVVLSTYGRAKISGTFSPGESLTIYCQLFVIDPGAAAGFASSLGGKLTVSP